LQPPRPGGRKRGRPPLQPKPTKVPLHNLYSAPALPVEKIPKKRGRKPGYKLKSRVLMPPLAISPPRSTPEPDISSIPQDAATIPNSATPQALTECTQASQKQWPVTAEATSCSPSEVWHSGTPGKLHPGSSLHSWWAACVFLCVAPWFVWHLEGAKHHGMIISASFEGKQHLLNLLAVNSIGYVLRFLKKLCRSLLCDNLFSNQPLPQHSAVPEGPEGCGNRKMEAAETATPEDYLVDPSNVKRFNLDPAAPASGCTGSTYTPRQTPADGHSAGGSSSSCSHRPAQTSSGGSSSTGLRHQTSSPTMNGSCLEGNRSASSPSSEQEAAAQPSSKNPLTWTVEDVVWFVKDADPHTLGPHVELFRKHEIDGNALLLLKSDMIMKYLGLKLGPALKLCYHIDKLKQAKF
ncbi:Sex comb on midleg-like 4, partial [Chaetura pelagica]